MFSASEGWFDERYRSSASGTSGGSHFFICATLCYMNKYPDSVGVRELRQNLSVYLRRVAAGQKLRVTERGRTVAALVPLREDESPFDRLVKQGRLIPPQDDLLKLGPPRGRPSTRASKALAELRRDRL